MFLLNNIVKIRKSKTEIAKNSMEFGGHLSHEFAIFGKFFCIDLLNAMSILVNDLNLALVWIPLWFMDDPRSELQVK